MIHQFIFGFVPYMQYQVVTLLAVSLKSTKKEFQILGKTRDELTDMRDFGNFLSLSLECSFVVAAIQFICCLYQENTTTPNVNELPYGMFTNQISEDRLPPTLDALVFHVCRADYQTFIWKSA